MRIILTLAACFALASGAIAQDRPLRPEPIEEAEGPLLMEGDVMEMAVPFTEGGSSVIFNNTDRTLVAIRGSYDFHLMGGGVKVIRWTQHLADPMAAGMGLAPRASQTLPPTRDPDGNLVPYINLTVTGILCEDGSGAGSDFEYLRKIHRTRAKARMHQLVQTMKMLEEKEEGELVDLLRRPEPFVTGFEAWVFHQRIRTLLLTDDRAALRENPRGILEEHLKNLDSL